VAEAKAAWGEQEGEASEVELEEEDKRRRRRRRDNGVVEYSRDIGVVSGGEAAQLSRGSPDADPPPAAAVAGAASSLPARRCDDVFLQAHFRWTLC
jgi:hypothetical protein